MKYACCRFWLESDEEKIFLSGTFQNDSLFQNSLRRAVLFANSFLLVCLVAKGETLLVILM